MKVLVVDDDKEILEKICNILLKYSFQNNIDIQIESSQSIPKSVQADIDVYFLDVEIGNNNIFDYLAKIRSINLDTCIIMVSSHEHYVIKSVKFNIFDFIRKRNLDTEIYETLNRLFQYSSQFLLTVPIKYQGGWIHIKLTDIMFIETSSHSCNIHMVDNRCYELYSDVKKVLNESINYYVKIHKSYYINIKYVKCFKNNMVYLVNNIELPLSRTYKKEFLQKYLNIY